MSATEPPRIGAPAVTVGDKGMICPKCGSKSTYVLAHIGGAYSYQPCGCYGGTVPK